MTNVTYNFFYVFIYIFNSLHVSSTSCSSSGETNCVNTNSGSCHSVSVAVSCAGRKFHFKYTNDLNTKKKKIFQNHVLGTSSKKGEAGLYSL